MSYYPAKLSSPVTAAELLLARRTMKTTHAPGIVALMYRHRLFPEWTVFFVRVIDGVGIPVPRAEVVGQTTFTVGGKDRIQTRLPYVRRLMKEYADIY